jgi:hypothetical protein
MPISSLPQAIRDGFEVHEWRHATAILETDFPGEWKDLCEVLSVFRLRGSYIAKGGGNKSDVSKWFDKHLNHGANCCQNSRAAAPADVPFSFLV